MFRLLCRSRSRFRGVLGVIAGILFPSVETVHAGTSATTEPSRTGFLIPRATRVLTFPVTEDVDVDNVSILHEVNGKWWPAPGEVPAARSEVPNSHFGHLRAGFPGQDERPWGNGEQHHLPVSGKGSEAGPYLLRNWRQGQGVSLGRDRSAPYVAADVLYGLLEHEDLRLPSS